jgi:hypothetical protein
MKYNKEKYVKYVMSNTKSKTAYKYARLLKNLNQRLKFDLNCTVNEANQKLQDINELVSLKALLPEHATAWRKLIKFKIKENDNS